jgi:hypothetical protein
MAKQKTTETKAAKTAKAKKAVALEPYADEKTDKVYGAIRAAIDAATSHDAGPTGFALIRVANQHAKLGNKVATKRDKATEALKKQLAKLQAKAAAAGVDVATLIGTKQQ